MNKKVVIRFEDFEDGSLTAKGVGQAAVTISGIKTVFTMVPAVLIVIGMVALFFCNLDKIYPQIAKGLEEKRANEK